MSARKKPAEAAEPTAWYKGFDGNLACRGFQYAVGQTYKHTGVLSLCQSGFHACEQPLDVLTHYPIISGNRYAEVRLTGVSKARDADSKRVATSITIVRELTVRELIDAQVAWTAAHADAASSGSYSQAASSGSYSKAACDTAGFACVAGIAGRVRGNAGSALSLGYRDAQDRNRIAVGYVGEDGIEAGRWYAADRVTGRLVAA